MELLTRDKNSSRGVKFAVCRKPMNIFRIQAMEEVLERWISHLEYKRKDGLMVKAID